MMKIYPPEKIASKRIDERIKELKLVYNLSEYLDIKFKNCIDKDLIIDYDTNELVFAKVDKVLVDRWETLWKKREELLWIKKINSSEFPVEKVMQDYLNGDIPKEKITKIYKELTKDI